MKYIFFIIVAFLLVQEIPAQIRLSTMTEVTSLDTADLFWVNEFVTPNWVNRKLKWLNLRSNMIDYIDGLANTWAQRQTFSNGATFSAASYGTVSFTDTVSSSHAMTGKIILPYDITSQVGTPANPFFRISARTFYIPNTESNDSVAITYDDSTLSINKTLNVSGLEVSSSVTFSDVDVSFDSGSVFNSMVFGNATYAPATVGDSIITLTTFSPSRQLDLPGNITSPGISKLHVNGASMGQIIRFWNLSDVYTLTFTKLVGDDDNLYMSADMTLGQLDNITFQCVDPSASGQVWMEISRTNVSP